MLASALHAGVRATLLVGILGSPLAAQGPPTPPPPDSVARFEVRTTNDGKTRLILGSEAPDPSVGFTVRIPGGLSVDRRSGTLIFAGWPIVKVVATGSPANVAGLEVGDRILEVDGADARVPPFLPNREAGRVYDLLVERAGRDPFRVKLKVRGGTGALQPVR
jgi:membrane-associated protease RseP (regulator of RpoE activity)